MGWLILALSIGLTVFVWVMLNRDEGGASHCVGCGECVKTGYCTLKTRKGTAKRKNTKIVVDNEEK